MLIKTRGILFRTVKYAESSIIVDIYTEEIGLRTYIISGVRSKNARITPGLIQVMSLVDLVAYEREDQQINRIKEIKASHVYHSLPFDVRKSAVGLFMIELARKTIREMEENQALFHFLHNSFVFLDDTENAFANVHLYFSIHLMYFLGFWPQGHFSEETPYFDLREGTFVPEMPHVHGMPEDLSAVFSMLLEMDLENIHLLPLNRTQRIALLDRILDFYRLHVEHFQGLNAHLILHEVL